MDTLILASTSRYRRALLERFGLPFSVVSPDTDETPLAGEKPQDLVVRLARAKANAVAEQYPQSIVIGSDQVAVHGDEIVGKPGDHANAKRQLASASGKRVNLLTAVAVVDGPGGTINATVVPYQIWFKDLTEAEIERYLVREKPWDCAGSLKIEGLGISLLERLQGDDPTAIVGLPLIETARLLRAAGLDPVLDA